MTNNGNKMGNKKKDLEPDESIQNDSEATGLAGSSTVKDSHSSKKQIIEESIKNHKATLDKLSQR